MSCVTTATRARRSAFGTWRRSTPPRRTAPAVGSYKRSSKRVSVAPLNTWVWNPTFKIRQEMEDSLKREPPIPPGTPDPYLPKK